MTEPIAPTRPEPGPIRPGPAAPPPDVGGGGIGGGGFLRGRTGGIPNWGWVVGGIAGGLLLLWWFRHGKQSNTDTVNPDGTTGNPAVTFDSIGAQESVLAQLRDLQGQVSTNPDTGTVPSPTTPTPTPTGPQMVSLGAGTDLNQAASGYHLSFSQFESLNQPWFSQNYRIVNGVPRVITGRQYRVA